MREAHLRQRRRRRGNWAVSLFVLLLAAGTGYAIFLLASSCGSDATAIAPGGSGPVFTEATRTSPPTDAPPPADTPRPEPSFTPGPPRIGLVAGHWKNDSGAVCPDGLEEVDINLEVASRAAVLLQLRGYDAQLLPEFSDALAGYQAAAFISIHADSCEFLGLSGFKVARVASSAIPEQEDRLVACLVREYAAATGLEFDELTITYDMTDYHAFWEIDPSTPGAIIELGFMGGDRDLLTNHSDRAAEGVARGIMCFLGAQ